MKLPWAEPSSRFTALFERLAIDWLGAASQKAVAERLNLSWDEIHGIMERAVRRGLARQEALPVKYLGVDEKAFRKGHKYRTLVNDLERGCVLYVAEDRKQSSLDGFWSTITLTQRDGIDAVAMDMWDPFVASVRKHLPEAEIVFDKFHIASHLGTAVDKVRRQENKDLLSMGDRSLVGSKSGLDYFLARDYWSSAGRFVSTDPASLGSRHVINPQDLNRYCYVANNPLGFIDPDGADKIQIVVSAFIPTRTAGGYHGDDRKPGEKIGERDGYRIRQTIVVETDPHRNNGGIIVSSRTELGITVGPDFRPGSPSFGSTSVTRASGDSLQMTAVRTGDEGGVSVNFSGNEQNALAPVPGNGVSYSLNVTVQSKNEREDAKVSVDGVHTGFPGFDIVVTRLEAENKKPTVVYGYDPQERGRSPLWLLPGMPKVYADRPDRTIPAKKRTEEVP